MKQLRNLALGLVISVATLAYALRGNDIAKLGEEFVHGKYLFLIPALFFVLVGLYLRAIRWRALLDGRLSVQHGFNCMNVGYFLNSFLPLRLGEVARSYLVTRLTPPISFFTSISSIIVERLIDLLTVVVLIALAMTLAPVTPEIATGTKITGVVATAGVLLLALFAARRGLAHWFVDLVVKILPFLKRFNIRHVADRLLDGIAPLGSPRGVFNAFFWTAVAWAASVVAGFVLFYVFYDKPNWASALLMISTASIAIALPAVPGSVGPFEAAVIVGLTVGGMVDPAAGLPQERAFAFAVLLHIVTVGSYAFLGVLGLAQERITLGDVMRSARQMAGRKQEESTNPVTENVAAVPSKPNTSVSEA